MKKQTSFTVIILSVVWIILSEDISWRTIITGLLVGVTCLYFSRKFLPFDDDTHVNFLKLMKYPVYLLGQIFISGIYVAKLVLTNSAKAGVVSLPTRLRNETLRVILMYSMTLTPGTIPFEIEGDQLKTLWLHDIKTPNDSKIADEMGKIPIENRLLKAEKDGE